MMINEYNSVAITLSCIGKMTGLFIVFIVELFVIYACYCNLKRNHTVLKK